jgi:3-hydroxy-9,10-secoandrosta-1,3,5(10)-triene-9,17-dione monooxygenase
MTVDHTEIMRRVEAIASPMATRAVACDEARQVVAENMRAMIDAGLFRIPQPARVGGYELSLRTFGAAVTELSRACSSSGWVLMVMGAHHWCLALFSARAQDEIFGDGRDGLVAGTLSWQGNAVAVDGGYRVNGRWQFASGIDHAEWVILGCADPQSHNPRVHVVVPVADLEIDDTWQVMGLQGSGSKDVLAHNVFVPTHRAVDTRELFSGASPQAAMHPTNLYRLSAEAMLCTCVSTAVLGSAQFALEQFIERTKGRKVILTGAAKAEHAPTQIRLAESASEIRAAHLLQQEVYDAFDRLLASGERFDIAHRTWVRWQVSYAAELCRRAVARLYSGSGAHAIYAPSALQRAFRNIQVGAQHANLDFETGAEQYGRLLLASKPAL